MPPGPTFKLSTAERQQYIVRQVHDAEKKLETATLANRLPGNGHTAAALLYDCFECLIVAAIAHTGVDLLVPKQTNIHNKQKKYFQALYKNQLPPEHYKLSQIIKRRNQIRYVNPKSSTAPWQIADFQQSKVDQYIRLMERYLEAIKKLLASPYQYTP